MQSAQPQQPSGRIAGNIAILVITGWAMTIYSPIRRHFGKDHFGIEGGIGLVWILLWSAFTHSQPLLWLVPLYLLSLFSHRVDELRRRWRGAFIHTYYSGEPWLAHGLSRIKDENTAKTLVEPLLSFFLGAFLLQYGVGVGMYFICGALALMSTSGMIAAQQQQRAIDEMRNGMIENQWLMGQFQRQGRRRF